MTYLALKSLDPAFADAFKNTTSLELLRDRFELTFWESYKQIPEQGKHELEKYSALSGLNDNAFPQDGNYQEIINALDDAYFDADEAGDKIKADLFFRLARFVSAVQFFYSSGARDQYTGAVYEALFSSEDAKQLAQEMVERFDVS